MKNGNAICQNHATVSMPCMMRVMMCVEKPDTRCKTRCEIQQQQDGSEKTQRKDARCWAKRRGSNQILGTPKNVVLGEELGGGVRCSASLHGTGKGLLTWWPILLKGSSVVSFHAKASQQQNLTTRAPASPAPTTAQLSYYTRSSPGVVE